MAGDVGLQRILQRDRRVIVAGLSLITGLSWLYLLAIGLAKTDGVLPAGLRAAVMPANGPWGWWEFGLAFAMWVVMMIAMMIPSAAPMILTYARIARRREESSTYGPSAAFVSGYLAIWMAFSLLATGLQSGLRVVNQMTSAMGHVSPLLGGLILIGAGVFQWTPLKHACLGRCRSPMGFLLEDWRPGWLGAFRMGISHGRYCAVCCWALMALMFVVGVMNLLWMSLVALLVLIEKVARGGDRIARVAGVGLALWGSGLALMALGVV